jgi:hypothetical protein
MTPDHFIGTKMAEKLSSGWRCGYWIREREREREREKKQSRGRNRGAPSSSSSSSSLSFFFCFAFLRNAPHLPSKSICPNALRIPNPNTTK